MAAGLWRPALQGRVVLIEGLVFEREGRKGHEIQRPKATIICYESLRAELILRKLECAVGPLPIKIDRNPRKKTSACTNLAIFKLWQKS